MKESRLTERGARERAVLIVVHDYPPIRSAGTERVLKFSQYLPEFGYRPVILTTARYGGYPDDRERRVYRANDLVHILFSPLRRGRAAGIAAEDQVRVATVTSSSLLGRLRDRAMVPDTKIGWRPPATRLGRSLIAQARPDLLFSSSPPETAHLIAGSLARATGVPWVADLRDGWMFEPPVPQLRQGRLRRTVEARMECTMARRAAAVVTVTDPISDDLRLRYAGLVRRVETISNGYDALDFASIRRARADDGRFRLTHTGAFSGSSQGRSAHSLFVALRRILDEDSRTPLRLELVGPVTEAERGLAEAHGIARLVEFVPPVPRREAYQRQVDADALLLVTAPGVRSVATSKLYDYIGAGKPVLALAEGNAAAETVERFDLGLTVAPDDPAAIAGALRELMRRKAAGHEWTGFAKARGHFERRSLTARLAALFDEVLEAR
jgi:glycosyltransferase involved in cell wall biosynthesis